MSFVFLGLFPDFLKKTDNKAKFSKIWGIGGGGLKLAVILGDSFFNG